MAGCSIEQTVEERDLGILIDNQLKFHDHVSMVIGNSRMLLVIGSVLINKSFINLSPLTFFHLYKAIIRPCLEYGNIIWGPTYKVDEGLIEKVQRKTTINWSHPLGIYPMKKDFSILGYHH